MAVQKHLRAVNRAIRGAELDVAGVDAPLVELLRDLARKMDRCGDDAPSDRLLAAYLSATKDLRRVTVAAARARPAAPVVPVVEQPMGPRAVERSPLDKLRDEKKKSAS